MINSKPSLKSSFINKSSNRSKSIYRGDHSHTASMHLKIDCDLSPETMRIHLPKQRENQKTYKQLSKENRCQKFRDELKIVEITHSAKKLDRIDLGERSGKKSFIHGRQLQTERILKETTNIQPRKEKYIRQQKEKRALQSNRKFQKQDTEQIAISEQDLKEIYALMKKISQQNNRLRRQLKFCLKQQQKSTTFMALLR